MENLFGDFIKGIILKRKKNTFLSLALNKKNDWLEEEEQYEIAIEYNENLSDVIKKIVCN